MQRYAELSNQSAVPSIDSVERAWKKLSKKQNKQNLKKINSRIGENKFEKRSHEWIIPYLDSLSCNFVIKSSLSLLTLSSILIAERSLPDKASLNSSICLKKDDSCC